MTDLLALDPVALWREKYDNAAALFRTGDIDEKEFARRLTRLGFMPREIGLEVLYLMGDKNVQLVR